jgi:hypothetical protein
MAEGADTGFFTPVTLPIKQMFKDLGWKIKFTEDVPLLETIKALQNQMALRLRNPDSGFGLTGNTSERDVKFLKDMVAGIEKTPEANRVVLTIMMAKQRRVAFLEREKAEYIFQTGSLVGWGKLKKQLIERERFLNEEETEFISRAAGGSPAPQGVPQNDWDDITPEEEALMTPEEEALWN